jgi:hypothetical protein
MLNLANPNALSTTSFTALGAKPERMTGCFNCFKYTTTQGRVNTIAVDPTTTMNGSIVAYLGAVGGGVWKTSWDGHGDISGLPITTWRHWNQMLHLCGSV